MSRYRFRLESVLRVRRVQEDRARVAEHGAMAAGDAARAVDAAAQAKRSSLRWLRCVP